VLPRQAHAGDFANFIVRPRMAPALFVPVN